MDAADPIRPTVGITVRESRRVADAPAGYGADRHTIGLAWLVIRYRRWILGLWIIVLCMLGPAAARVEQVLDVSARVEHSESAAVDEILRTRFASPFARNAVLVITGTPALGTAEGDSVLRYIVERVRAVSGVTGTISWLDAGDSLFAPSTVASSELPRATMRAGGTFVIAGVDPSGISADAMVPRLRAATAEATDQVRTRYPAVTLRWTGDIALNYDIRRTSASEGQRAERRALPLTLVMLLVAFGTVAAAAISVAAGVAGIVAALGVASIAATHWPLSILLSNIVSMIGLGLGIDYALLTVSRFREELAEGCHPHDAAARAARVAGHTVLLSGCAVLIGFLALAIVPLNELRAIAIGGVLVVVCSVLVALTLLPALLAMLGARIDAGRLMRRRARRPIASERWRRWGHWVTRHPVMILVATGVPLMALAMQVRRIDTGLPRSDWLPRAMESAQALADLGAMGRAGVVQSLRIIVQLPPGTSALEGDGWRGIARLHRALAADPRIARVQSVPGFIGSDEPSLMAITLLPAQVRSAFISRDQRAAVLEILPHSADDFPAVTQLVRDLRAANLAGTVELESASVIIGGMPAFNADYEDAIDRRLPLVIGLVLGGTLLALLVGFRSVLIPLKALALNLVSVAAALGAVVIVFQDGYGSGLVGLNGGMGSLFPALPVLVFCIVFGLSMDYEVFLVARVAEARRAGAGEAAAIADGLARTGGTITSAAAIMIVVFAAFVLGDFLMIKVLGFALATAVLLDATVVRIAIGPALLALAGRWNWWPGTRPARQPVVSAGEASPVASTHPIRSSP